MVMLGVLVGLLASLGLSRFIANMVFHRNSYDALTFVSVAVILFAAALVASCSRPDDRPALGIGSS